MYVHLTFFTEFKEKLPTLRNKAKNVVTSLSMSYQYIDRSACGLFNLDLVPLQRKPQLQMKTGPMCLEVKRWNVQWTQKGAMEPELR